jgi:hypothetical protein
MQRLVLAACCLFVLLGAALIPYAGIQNDEAIFGNVLYQPTNRNLCVIIFHRSMPLMISDHIGTLKTLLYWPIFAVFPPGVFSVRLPMVLAGALTIWILFRFAILAVGPRAALFAALLLATDPSFLLTVTFDWGPVAIERLLLVTACLCAARFVKEQRRLDLAAAFFLIGLAMWNRADFVWALAGIGAGAVAVFWSEIRRFLSLRNVGLAMVSFVLGALPLLIYNIHRPNATLGGNARLEFDRFAPKVLQLRQTADGSDLFGYLVSEEGSDRPKAPYSLRGRTAQWIRNHLGTHRRNGTAWALALAIVAVPLWWRSRVARFALVFMTVTWLSMAVTRDAGAAAHHVMMLWPFPQLFLAIAIGSLRWPMAGRAIIGALVVLNLLVVNQYFLQFERDGAGDNFTDALLALSDAIAEDSGRNTYVTDWGMLNTIELLHQGRAHASIIAGLFTTDTPSPEDREMIASIVSDSQALFVGHAPNREALPRVQERLALAASSSGHRKELVRVIADSNGRPVFELYRFAAAEPPAP